MTTEQKHTPEPWTRVPVKGGAGIVYHRIISGAVAIGGLYGKDDANAARIVACVNYCAGTPNELLECTSDQAGRAGSGALSRERLVLMAQRHELLEVLRVIAGSGPLSEHATVAAIERLARVAIAKAGGAQ